MLRFKKEELNSFLNSISSFEKVYAPTEVGGNITVFAPYTKDCKVDVEYNTDCSPKDFFFPQVENICRFKVSGKTIEVIDKRDENEDFVVFGMRACDVKAIDVLDKVFLAEPVDGYYKGRRDHGTIISLACSKMKETCFCGTFGIDCAAPQGDVEAYELDGYYYLNPVTEKGKVLLSKLTLEEGSDDAIWDAKKAIYAKKATLPLANLTTDKFGAGKTKELFSSPKWAELSKSCLGCGTCTFVCPTCQCYDIRDYDTGHGVIRYRCWDSCMYTDFTKMSAGQPRQTQVERFRQRFMHKLVYFPDNNNGEFSCVGCGRCLQKCPQHLNIVKVIKKMQEED